jgi:Na+/H+-translocating membrane pyrophosphatase
MSATNMNKSMDAAHLLVRGELSSGKRWFYRMILLAASIVLAVVLSLWATEPGPLPNRLHFSFGAMTLIACGWIGVLSWILSRRLCPTAIDRIATAWMATLACGLFLAVALPTSLLRSQLAAAAGLSLVGLMMLGVSLSLLRSAYAWRTELRDRLAELESLADPM